MRRNSSVIRYLLTVAGPEPGDALAVAAVELVLVTRHGVVHTHLA